MVRQYPFLFIDFLLCFLCLFVADAYGVGVKPFSGLL